ncbi:hypothetical protein [Winogradskyella tangerina]|uniref:hypothetical protein n=1 Tax=Winogradskyella tangerina TaxID=2023240 RepID=UPI000DBE2C53|nr:hypothetical protein [Winogradskyella tangerina]
MKFKKSKNGQDSIRINTVKHNLYLSLFAIVFTALSVAAQTTPEPPTPPETPKTSSSKSYSVSVENDDNERQNSSVSVSVSDDSYKFRARFHNSKTEGLKNMIMESLSDQNLTVKGSTYLWTDAKSGDDIFECKLSKGQLRIYLDTEVASKDFTEDIKLLGEELKYYISGSSAKVATRELEKAERELGKAERELARAKREAKRAVKN